MANANPSRLGQVNQTGDVKAIFLKKYAGEVLTAYQHNVTLRERTRLRVIENGKSASFPAIARASGGYHVPGEELLGRNISHAEVIIPVDDQLISDAFIPNIDEAMNHYDVRAPYSNEQGAWLAEQFDSNIARNLVRAARGAALFTGEQGGSTVNSAGAATTATVLAGQIWAGKQAMEERRVPVDREQVYAALLPAQWYLLAQEPTLILNRDVDGDGSYSRGTFSLIGGVQVIKSTNYPWGVDDSGNSDLPADYRVNMSTTLGMVFTAEAAATVQLRGMSMEQGWDMRRQGTLMIAKYIVGHGALRTKCAHEIRTADPS